MKEEKVWRSAASAFKCRLRAPQRPAGPAASAAAAAAGAATTTSPASLARSLCLSLSRRCCCCCCCRRCRRLCACLERAALFARWLAGWLQLKPSLLAPSRSPPGGARPRASASREGDQQATPSWTQRLKRGRRREREGGGREARTPPLPPPLSLCAHTHSHAHRGTQRPSPPGKSLAFSWQPRRPPCAPLRSPRPATTGRSLGVPRGKSLPVGGHGWPEPGRSRRTEAPLQGGWALQSGWAAPGSRCSPPFAWIRRGKAAGASRLAHTAPPPSPPPLPPPAQPELQVFSGGWVSQMQPPPLLRTRTHHTHTPARTSCSLHSLRVAAATQPGARPEAAKARRRQRRKAGKERGGGGLSHMKAKSRTPPLKKK